MSEQSKTMQMRAQTLKTFENVCGERERSKRAKQYRSQSAKIVDDLFVKLNTELNTHTLLECGAHEATASMEFMKAGGKRAIAIEANPTVFNERTKLAEEFGAETLNVGLADSIGEMVFHLIPDSKFPGNSSFHGRTGGSVPITVKTTTIDTIKKDHKITQKLCLWVDVEGFAFQVLQGASKTLKSPKTIILKVEMEDSERWVGQITAHTVAPIVEKAGFEPVLVDFEFVGQFNVIYVRPDILKSHSQAIKHAQDELANLSKATLS